MGAIAKEKDENTIDSFVAYFKVQTSQQSSLISIWIDRQTGVNYLYTWSAQGCALTPLLDENGKVIATQIGEANKQL
ncbi:DUF6440 family protein [Sutcliffiella horikoshii]|uniref:DUF6440 family protein n=1 Tax=Sutcliffiella horikoshii TaxID=79883 RepID=UPI001F426F18|nr:DUF6440 family protein [Sutcliffiella horikoshii]